MAKSPDKLVADIDAEQNKEDLNLPKRIGEAVVKGVKTAKDYAVENLPKFVKDVIKAKEASELPVEKKAKGGSVKSASARADGCAIRGKTRA